MLLYVLIVYYLCYWLKETMAVVQNCLHCYWAKVKCYYLCAAQKLQEKHLLSALLLHTKKFAGKNIAQQTNLKLTIKTKQLVADYRILGLNDLQHVFRIAFQFAQPKFCLLINPGLFRQRLSAKTKTQKKTTSSSLQKKNNLCSYLLEH